MLNERQDYFGQTVNIASRVQNMAATRSILATDSVIEYPQTSQLLEHSGVRPLPQLAALRGLSESVKLYEIP